MIIFHFDFPKFFDIGFADPATRTAEKLISLHNDIFFYLIFIVLFVLSFLHIILKNFSDFSFKIEKELQEDKNNIVLDLKKLTNFLKKRYFKFLGYIFFYGFYLIEKDRLVFSYKFFFYLLLKNIFFISLFLSYIWFFSLFNFIEILVFHIIFIPFYYQCIQNNWEDDFGPFWRKMIIDFQNLFLILKINFLHMKLLKIYRISFFERYLINRDNINHHSNLEIIWTLIPSLILLLIAFPSLKFLYAMDHAVASPFIIKAIGHQWYWTYEYGKNPSKLFPELKKKSLTFDSYMIPYDDLEKGQIRLLSCDNSLTLPVWVNIRILVTSEDVLHSWAVPSLALKIDAVPGRLNQNFFLLDRPGVFFGQCSEICGTNHGFMPINITACYPDIYIYWYFNVLAGTSREKYLNFDVEDFFIIEEQELLIEEHEEEDNSSNNNNLLNDIYLNDNFVNDYFIKF